MAKIIIESNGDTTFRFKKYPDEEFQIKAKIFEIKKIENSSEVYTVKATQANTGELLFSEKISDITVDGAVYTNYEDLSEVLTPLLFKKGGGSGGGGTGDGIVKQILSGSDNVSINSNDPTKPIISVDEIEQDNITRIVQISMTQLASYGVTTASSEEAIKIALDTYIGTLNIIQSEIELYKFVLTGFDNVTIPLELVNNAGTALPTELGTNGIFVVYGSAKRKLKYTDSTVFTYTPTGNFTLSAVKTLMESQGYVFNDSHIIIQLGINNYTWSIDIGASNPNTIFGFEKTGTGSLSITSTRTLNAANSVNIMNGSEGSMGVIRIKATSEYLDIVNL